MSWDANGSPVEDEMDEQQEREAAARAFDASPNDATLDRMRSALILPHGWCAPLGSASTFATAISAWLAHVRAMDAKAATPEVKPDPLAGVVWRSPWAVYVFCSVPSDGPLLHPEDGAVLDGVARDVGAETVAAHARAQLDAEATAIAEPEWHKAEAARQAADARKILEALGYKVEAPKPVADSGYGDAAAVLAWLEARARVVDTDTCAYWARARTAFGPCANREIARLRALGVKPAVLT